MKSLIIVLTFIGLLSIAVGYINQQQRCPAPTIEYRYIPRTFQQDQDNPVRISELYHAMFTEPTPWIKGIGNSHPKNNELNRYYISQS